MINSISNLNDVNLRERDLFAVELINGKEVLLHVIRQPLVTEPGFYRASLSGNAFKSREIKIWYDRYYTKRKVMPRQFSIRYSSDFEIETRLVVNKYLDHQWWSLPILDHESIWEFYKHIGYDHKKKKYIPQKVT